MMNEDNFCVFKPKFSHKTRNICETKCWNEQTSVKNKNHAAIVFLKQTLKSCVINL